MISGYGLSNAISHIKLAFSGSRWRSGSVSAFTTRTRPEPLGNASEQRFTEEGQRPSVLPFSLGLSKASCDHAAQPLGEPTGIGGTFAVQHASGVEEKVSHICTQVGFSD